MQSISDSVCLPREQKRLVNKYRILYWILKFGFWNRKYTQLIFWITMKENMRGQIYTGSHIAWRIVGEQWRSWWKWGQILGCLADPAVINLEPCWMDSGVCTYTCTRPRHIHRDSNQGNGFTRQYVACTPILSSGLIIHSPASIFQIYFSCLLIVNKQTNHYRALGAQPRTFSCLVSFIHSFNITSMYRQCILLMQMCSALDCIACWSVQMFCCAVCWSVQMCLALLHILLPGDRCPPHRCHPAAADQLNLLHHLLWSAQPASLSDQLTPCPSPSDQIWSPPQLMLHLSSKRLSALLDNYLIKVRGWLITLGSFHMITIT